MKHTRIIVLILSLALLAGCTSRTEFGDCIGIADDKDPKLVYKVSAWNLFWAFVGFELILPPILVLANETSCPVGRK